MPGLRSRAVVVPLRFTRTTPQPSPARDTFPSAGLSWSRVCAAKAGPLGDSADGTRLGRRLPRRHGWHPWRGGRLQKVGNGSPRNSIANTRPTETVVGALQSHVYLRHSATTCGLELAHAPQLANTHAHLIVTVRECEIRASRRQLDHEEGVHRHLTRPHIRSRPCLAGRRDC